MMLTGASFAEPTAIAALGDSLTQGYGLPADQGFVPQLDRWLTAQGADVTMINAGVSGDTTAGGLSRIDWTLTDDVDALIVALGGNDVLRGIPPETARANLTGILDRAAARDLPVLLIGITVPANYGPDYQTAFTAIYPDLAADYDALLYPNFLAALTTDTDLDTAFKTLMQSDGIHPNAAGVAKIVNDLGPHVLTLIEQGR
ncbi:arylesterase [Rhodovulum sp. FJ3]|nr:arylesterase [Rhodovulum sp. FJ3]MDV4169419.1 arylesterase [Rhodovulum sp. FJ3]